MFAIEVADFKKKYGSTSLGVERVSFNISYGEVFGFIGPNGAGKTTTIRAIMGLLKPDSGLVNVAGKDAFSEGHLVRDFVSYVPSEINVYGGMTVRKYIEFMLDQKGRGYEKIDSLCTYFELNQNRKTNELSLGNKKKLAIVCALANSPKVLVLDEATIGLDPLIQQKLFEIIEVERKRGTAILLSSHNLNEIQRCCDRVGIIKNGVIVAIKEIGEFKHRLLKHVVLETKIAHLGIELDGVEDLKINGNRYEFNFHGDMKTLNDYIASLDVTNVTITDVDLNDEFMRWY